MNNDGNGRDNIATYGTRIKLDGKTVEHNRKRNNKEK